MTDDFASSPACEADQPRGPVVRRGSRLHQRHLSRPAAGPGPTAGQPRPADPDRPDRNGAAYVSRACELTDEHSTLVPRARRPPVRRTRDPGPPLRGPLRPRPDPRQQPGLGLRRAPAARRRRRDGRPRGRRRRQQGGHRRPGAPGRGRALRRHAPGDAPGRLRGQRAPARGDPRVPAARGHGDDAHRDPVRRRPARAVPRRRLPRLPGPRRPVLADHPRRHVRPDADRRRPDHRRGGQQPPPALAAAAGPQRPGRRARPLDARGPRRRPLPPVLRRPLRRGQRGDPRRGAEGPRPAGHRRPADRARAAQRRTGQRHRDRRRRRRRRRPRRR